MHHQILCALLFNATCSSAYVHHQQLCALLFNATCSSAYVHHQQLCALLFNATCSLCTCTIKYCVLYSMLYSMQLATVFDCTHGAINRLQSPMLPRPCVLSIVPCSSRCVFPCHSDHRAVVGTHYLHRDTLGRTAHTHTEKCTHLSVHTDHSN